MRVGCLFLVSLLAGSLFLYSQDSIIYLRASDATTLDLNKPRDFYSNEVLANIFEGLVNFDKNTLQIMPCLATHWEMQDNGRKWIFYLRPGVKFHNGADFNAQAVVETFQKYIKSGEDDLERWVYLYSYIDRVKALSDDAVEIILRSPYAPFLVALASPAAFIGLPQAKSDSDSKPIGTGPFQFSSWVKGKYITLARNDHYWRKPPEIAKVVFKVMADEIWRSLQLKNGNADVSVIRSSKEYIDLSAKKEIAILEHPSFATYYLAFNFRKKIFAQLKIREAFVHLFNKTSLIRHIFQHLAIPARTFFPPYLISFEKEIPDYDFDINLAKKLLQQAGYGSGFSCTLYIAEGMSDINEIADRLILNASKINIIIRKVQLPFPELLKAADQGDHDLLILGWASVVDPDFLYPLFTLNKGNRNRSFYQNRELVQILESARGIFDLEKRKTLYYKALKIIHDDIPSIPLFHPKDAVAYRRQVSQLFLNPLGYLIFKDARKETR